MEPNEDTSVKQLSRQGKRAGCTNRNICHGNSIYGRNITEYLEFHAV